MEPEDRAPARAAGSRRSDRRSPRRCRARRGRRTRTASSRSPWCRRRRAAGSPSTTARSGSSRATATPGEAVARGGRHGRVDLGIGSRTRPPTSSRLSRCRAIASGLGARGEAVDDAGGVAAVRRRRTARIELDLVDEVGVDHARAGEQVEQHRHRRAVDLVSRSSSGSRRGSPETATATRPTRRRAAPGSRGTDRRTCRAPAGSRGRAA